MYSVEEIEVNSDDSSSSSENEMWSFSITPSSKAIKKNAIFKGPEDDADISISSKKLIWSPN